MHTENAHEIKAPDYFMLSCLKGDKNAQTIYYLVDDIVSVLPKDILLELQKSNFVMKTGDSYNKKEHGIGAIMRINDHGFYEAKVNTASGRCEAVTPKAKQALDYIKDFFSTSNIPSVNLEQGDIMLLNNRRVLHGRTAFDISTTDQDRRWLQRLYMHQKNQKSLH